MKVIPPCELVNGEWKDCVFDTVDDAQKAIDDYREVWGRGGYIYEVEEKVDEH